MEKEFFSCRKRNVSPLEQADYQEALDNFIIETLRFSRLRGARTLQGAHPTRVYQDTGESEIEHATLTFHDGRDSVHANLFLIKSPLHDEISTIRKHITEYSQAQGYSVHFTLADSLAQP